MLCNVLPLQVGHRGFPARRNRAIGPFAYASRNNISPITNTSDWGAIASLLFVNKLRLSVIPSFLG